MAQMGMHRAFARGILYEEHSGQGATPSQGTHIHDTLETPFYLTTSLYCRKKHGLPHIIWSENANLPHEQGFKPPKSAGMRRVCDLYPPPCKCKAAE